MMTRHTDGKVPEQRVTRQSRTPRRRRPPRIWPARVALLVTAGLIAAATGCEPPPPDTDHLPAADTVPQIDASPIPLGVDVLLHDSLHLIEGRRVGLITNHTGVSWPAARSPHAGRAGSTPEAAAAEPIDPPGPDSLDADGRSTIDRLHARPEVDLVALFSPEHGIRGDVDRPVDSSVDERTGLPIHSLYGDTRKPTPEMLEGLDALVFDIQDIGTRYYSYVWTMALAMEAAAEHGLRFVVLDRPNPLAGRLVQGNVKPSYMPVAYYEAAMRHGLTAGELALYVNGEYDLGADLHVVPMDGWTRDMWWEDTGVPWRPPSPNMPSVESATHYPGTCLFEGTNLSVGRGTPRAFQQWGAPWLDAETLVAELRERGFEGVAFDTVTFTPDAPTDGKYSGEAVLGIRQTVTDRAVYDPVPVAVAALLEITRLHPDTFRWREGWFDGLAGGPRLREQIQAGATLRMITAPWPDQQAAFEARRRPYLLYP